MLLLSRWTSGSKLSLDLSMALLVRNPPLERLLPQIDFMSAIVSEFIIVDTGSPDDTIFKMSLMNKHPFGLPKVKIVRRGWRDDFAWARNEALPHITRSWVLILDPDELPNMAMMRHLEHVVTGNAPKEAAGYLYFSRNYFDGTLDPPMEHHWHVRLFRAGRARLYRPLDELVELDGLGEPQTRGTSKLPKAPKDAYIIHSKSGSAIDESERLYSAIAKQSPLVDWR